MAADGTPEPDGAAGEDAGPPARRPPSRRPPSLRIEEAAGAAAMALIFLISFGNVVVRYVTDISFAFTEEFSVFLLVFMTFVGASLAVATDSHIRITFFRDRLGPRGRFVCEALSLLASTAMFSLIVWYGAQLTLDDIRWEETSPGLGLPRWIYTIWLPVLSAAIVLRLLGRLRRLGLGRV